MCTVSVVAVDGRMRLLCNRDERHMRPDGLAPRVRRTAAGLSMFPVDPTGGGTWIAANDAGLVFATLNDDGPADDTRSRGRIALEMLGCVTLTEVLLRADLLRRAWSPHRLVAADGRRVLEVRIGERAVDVGAWDLSQPRFFTSSSLGRAVVEGPRRELFDAMVVGVADHWPAQEAFHRHRWPDRPHLSVDMRRHDAGTQSLTEVEVGDGQVRMRYTPTREAIGAPAWLAVERRVRSSPVLWQAAPDRALARAS